MYILDTDHITVFDRGGKSQVLLSKLAVVEPSQVVTTIVHEATLRTRNFKDFGQIAGLRIEGWTF